MRLVMLIFFREEVCSPISFTSGSCSKTQGFSLFLEMALDKRKEPSISGNMSANITITSVSFTQAGRQTDRQTQRQTDRQTDS